MCVGAPAHRGESVALRIQFTDKMRRSPLPRLRFDLRDPLWQDRREVGGVYPPCDNAGPEREPSGEAGDDARRGGGEDYVGASGAATAADVELVETDRHPLSALPAGFLRFTSDRLRACPPHPRKS